MALPSSHKDDLEKFKFKESTAEAGQTAVVVVNPDGSSIGNAAGGTQYTEGATDASITGTAILWEDTSNTLATVSAANPLPVSASISSVTITDIQDGAGDSVMDAANDAIKVSIVNDAAGIGGGTQYAEDAAHNTGDTGTMALAVRNDTLEALAGTDGDYTPLQVNADGALYTIRENDVVDSNNSTTSTLTANTDYTGTGTDLLGYAGITVTIFADQDSDAGGLRFEFSSDGTNWDISKTFDYKAGTGREFQFSCEARYFRVTFQNGGTNQTAFRLQTILHRSPVALTTIHRADDNIAVDRSATLVKSILMAQAAGAGDFTPIDATSGGNLKVAIEEISDGLDIGAGNAGTETQRVSIATDDVNLSAIKTAVEGTLTVDLGVNNDVTLATLPDTASGDLAAINASTDGIEGLLTTIDSDTSTLAGTDFMLGTDFSAVFGANTLLTTTQADSIVNTVDTLNATAFGQYFNGTTWDRMRGDSTNGLLVNLGGNNDVTVTGTVDLGSTDNAVLDTIASPVATISSTPLQRVAIFDGSDTQITSFGGGTQYTEDAAAPANPVGTAMMAVRDDALAGLTPVEGDWSHMYMDANGALYVTLATKLDNTNDSILVYANTAKDGSGTDYVPLVDSDGNLQIDVLSSALPTGAATAANQSTIIGHVDGIEGLLTTIDSDTSSLAALVTTATLADDLVNTTDVLNTRSLGYAFDGTTWDRLRGDSTNGLLVNLGSNNDVTVTNATAANLKVDGSDVTQPISASSLPLPSGASTAANQTTIIGHVDGIETLLGTIDSDTSTLAGAVSGTEMQVDLVGSIPAGTNAIGTLLPPDTDVTAHTNYARKYYTASTPTDGIIWSPAAGKRWHVTTMYINVSADSTITLEDDKAGGDDPVWKGEIAANSGVVLQFPAQYPMASGEDAADLTITATAGTVYVTCVGYEI